MDRHALNERTRLGGYREFAPPADLRGLVAALWSYERPFDAPPVPGRGHRLPPDADLSIALITKRDERNRLVDAQLALIGPIETPRFFSPERGLRLDAIRIHPEWCRDLIDVHPRDLVNAVIPFQDAAARRLDHVLGRLAESERPLVDLLDEMRRLSGADAVISSETRLANEVLRRVRRSTRSTLSIAALCRSLEVSERHLRRVVRQTAGFSPKHLQRIERLERAIAAADVQPSPDWARIAGESGYYDQAHMIDEFRALAGGTPAELFRERAMERGMSEISNR